MIPVPATQTQADMWSELDGGRGNKAYVIGGPEEGDDVIGWLTEDDVQACLAVIAALKEGNDA